MPESSPLAAALADRYTIERELGRGGMATVYLARDIKHDRMVALKVLLPDLAVAVGAERFLREIRTAAGLSHPHILPLYDSGEAAGTFFYAMPLAQGESLRERLTRDAQLPIAEALQIARDVAGALGYAHQQGIVHRDIKPENILLSAGHAVVADFGIAAVIGAAGDAKLTGTGMAIGTPAYMSPEQAAGERVDGRSDVYSLGCVLYEMLAGAPPFAGPSAQAVVARHLADPVPSIRTVRATVPRMLEQVVMKTMAKAPADRFATAAEFARALPREVDALAVESAPSGATPGRRRWPWALGIAAALALAAFGIARLTGRRVAAKAPGTVRSLGVLPFRYLGDDTAQAYVAEGVTQEVFTNLTRVGAVRVIHLNSLRATDLSENHVDVVLAGTVQRAGGTVHVTVNLTSASTDSALYSAFFDDDVERILTLQARVAESVATRIRVSMTDQERSRLTGPRRLVIPAAYEAYVRGSSVRGRQTVPAMERALSYFRAALDVDPAYADAWAGYSRTYANMGYFGMRSPEETFPQAREAAEKALRLDPELGEAHLALATVEFQSGWHFNDAEREFRRALALDPRLAPVHAAYGVFLAGMNRGDSGMAEVTRAWNLDPLNSSIRSLAARPFYNAGHYDSAIALSRSALELDSLNPRAHYWLGLSYEATGRLAQALRELERTVAIAPVPMYQSALGHALAVAGRRADALAILQQLVTPSPGRYVSPYDIATVQAGLGDRAAAMDWLDRAYAGRAPYLVLLGVDPHFAAYHSDPRFRDLLRRIGLPPAS